MFFRVYGSLIAALAAICDLSIRLGHARRAICTGLGIRSPYKQYMQIQVLSPGFYALIAANAAPGHAKIRAKR